MMKKTRSFKFGPGALVTAAFIGPGTITTCSLAGAGFGYALLWGLLFSLIATIVLQEMSARLGIISHMGLGEALRKQFTDPLPRAVTVILVISAITIGNAAFETGNLLGTSLGLQSLFSPGHHSLRLYVIITALSTFVILMIGSYRIIEKVMIVLVIIMSLTFVATAVIVSPDIREIINGMFIPSVPKGSIIALVGLIGTTVVPYNLFLHSSAVQEKWKYPGDIPAARTDISVSVLVGVIISMAIVITSAAAFYGMNNSIVNGTDLGQQLEPLVGKWARYFIGTGLFAAGISSSITAPLAAGYATTGILGWSRDIRSFRFRIIWIFILAAGSAFALIGFKPVEAIVFGQVANGILLPVIAIFLLYVMNSKEIIAENTNNLLSNILGIIVVLVVLGLGLWSLLHAVGVI
jgi:manganese transport protein